MEISKGVTVEYKQGKIALEVQVASLINPALDKFEADLESGAVDPIKGTSLDKDALKLILNFIRSEINK